MNSLQNRRLGFGVGVACLLALAAYEPISTKFDLIPGDQNSYNPKQVIAGITAGILNVTVVYTQDT